MRVGLVCPYDLAAPGGVQEQVMGLARSLRRGGHGVVVIAPGRSPVASDTVALGRVWRIPVNGSVAPMAPQPTAGIRAIRELRRRGVDVVHLHEPFAPSVTVPVLLAHVAPTVATFHAAGDRTPYRVLGSVLAPLGRRIDVRVAVSEPAARLARSASGGTYEVLANAVELDRYHGTDGGACARSGRTVLFLGRHEQRKGLAVLLDALAWLPADVTVWVAGDGPETAALRRMHGHDRRVVWLGRIGHDEKVARLRAASVVCAPSLGGESFGLVLLEAMAASTPVVASDLPGYRVVTGERCAARLVPPGDARALATGITAVLDDALVASALVACGDRRAAASSMDALASAYVTLYERAIDGHQEAV